MKHLKSLKEFLNEEYVMQHLEKEYNIVLDVWDNGEYLELGKIEVPKNLRSLGVGTKAMERIVKMADEQNKDIRLTPSKDFGATSVSRLEKFYRTFGFVKNKDLKYKDTMVRYSK